MTRSLLHLARAVALFALIATSWVNAEDPLTPVNAFSLPNVASPEQSFDSTAHPDAIIVLDFFAHWCGPCIEASRTVSTEIEQYFAKKAGTENGSPVQVIAVNVDQTSLSRTQRFMQKAGLTTAFDDPSGALFNSFNPPGLPFVIVLGPQEKDARPLHYQSSGHLDPQKLRAAIETASLPRSPNPGTPTPSPQAAKPSPNPAPAPQLEPIPKPTPSNQPLAPQLPTTASAPQPPAPPISAPNHPFKHSLSTVYETMRSDDVSLSQWDTQWTIEHANWTAKQTLTFSAIDLDFIPSDRVLIGQPAKRDETRTAFSTSLARDRGRTSLEFRAGASHGFQDYRSLWLSEFYHQGFQHNPAYQNITPSMYNAGLSGSRTLPNNQGRISLSADYQKDHVSPPYERVIPENPKEPIYTDIGLTELHTYVAASTLEYILNKRNLANVSINTSDTTGRDLRSGINLNLKTIWGEHWVSTLRASAVEESDAFSSRSAEIGLERDWDDRWFLGATYRVYQDQGTVQDPTIVSTEAPPLDTTRYSLRLAYRGDKYTASLSWQRYASRYGELSENSFQFETLYQDRNWHILRLAISKSL